MTATEKISLQLPAGALNPRWSDVQRALYEREAAEPDPGALGAYAHAQDRVRQQAHEVVQGRQAALPVGGWLGGARRRAIVVRAFVRTLLFVDPLHPLCRRAA